MTGICGLVDLGGAPPDGSLLEAVAAASSAGPCCVTRAALAGAAGFASREPPERALSRLAARDGVLVVGDLRLDDRIELAASVGGGTGASDVDLVLRAYRRWGSGLAEHLEGEFACAVWDGGVRRLLLVRDRFGLKTLHWIRVGETVLFASEAEQLLEHPGAPAELDEETLGNFLCGLNGGGERTFFRGIAAVPAATTLVVDPVATRRERFWRPDPERRLRPSDDGEIGERFREALFRAVRSRSRVESGSLGVLLSGGLDSGALAALATRVADRSSGGSVVAGSLVFPHLPVCDERPYRDGLVRDLGLKSVEVDAGQVGLFDPAAGAYPRLESPQVGLDACFREVCRRLQERGVGVLLTGQGADDVVGGSSLAWLDRLLRGDLRAIPAVVRHARATGRSPFRALDRVFVRPLLPPAIERRARRLLGRERAAAPGWLTPDFVRRSGVALRADLERRGSSARPWARERARSALFEAVVGSGAGAAAGPWYDRFASAHGIEVRHPFFDRRLVELVLAMPADRSIEPGRTKPLLRDATKGLLPDLVRLRVGKTSLVAFHDHELTERSASRVDDLLRSSAVGRLGVCDEARVRAALERYRRGDLALREGLKNLLALEIWVRRHGSRLGIAAAAAGPGAGSGAV